MLTAPPTADLTAKARIRIAALELFAERGSAAATMRQVAGRAGVTVGLVTHHYGSKNALRQAVEEYVIELYREALSVIPPDTAPHQLADVRDDNIARMLRENIPLQKYLRRSLLAPADERSSMLERLTDLTRDEVQRLRTEHIASTRRSVEDQTAQVMIRQLGELLMQPLVDGVWRRLHGDGTPAPTVQVVIERSRNARRT